MAAVVGDVYVSYQVPDYTAYVDMLSTMPVRLCVALDMIKSWVLSVGLFRFPQRKGPKIMYSIQDIDIDIP